ncbi:MAG: 30S ribosomal protein S20 [Clostridiales bacterium]|nr:30S ribosomal protein S20 [Clostridiales bacterium]
MPNIKSAAERVRLSQKQKLRNKSARSAMKTTIKKFDAAVQTGDAAAIRDAYGVAVKSVDRAATKGLIHKNNAAHKKSAMTLKVNAAGK